MFAPLKLQDTLSKDDQALLLKQAQNEFNKKFRSGTIKTDSGR